MKIKKHILRVVFVLLLTMILISFSGCSDAPSDESHTTETSSPSQTKKTGPNDDTPMKQAISYPQLPKDPCFDVDWSRALEVLPGADNVVIVGNGQSHVIDGIVKGSNYDDSLETGIRYPFSNVQYSMDRSLVGIIITEADFYADDGAAGKLLLYDGTNETVVADEVMSFSVSADGSHVAYLTHNPDREEGGNLYLYDVYSGEATRLTNRSGPAYVLSVSGRTIAYTELDFYDPISDFSRLMVLQRDNMKADGKVTAESWRVIIKSEDSGKAELTKNMFPIAVSDDGSNVYALNKPFDRAGELWFFQDGEGTCIAEKLRYAWLSSNFFAYFNCACSEVLFYANENIYYSQNGEKSVFVAKDLHVVEPTILFHFLYVFGPNRYLCTDSLRNVIFEAGGFWFIDDNLEVFFLSDEDVFELYCALDDETYPPEFSWSRTTLSHNGSRIFRVGYFPTIENWPNKWDPLEIAINKREGQPDIKYYLKPKRPGIFFSEMYVLWYYHDLYMIEEPFDKEPIKIAENVRCVRAGRFGVFYLALEETQVLSYLSGIKTAGDPLDWFDHIGVYYSADGEDFHKVAQTRQRYYPVEG